MTDLEIQEYLNIHNHSITSQDCIMNILNTSPQIIKEEYNFITKMFTFKTSENIFTVKLILKQL